MRPSKRRPDALRPISFERHFTKHAEGSVLCSYGDTRVLCNVSIETGVPRFLRDSGQGWLTCEYGMLPRSTHDRMNREAARGKQSGRTVEIQRLIGRALRAAVDLKKLDGMTVTIDCDVLQADGGTRTAAISGSCVALVDALRHLQRSKKLLDDPLRQMIAGVSVGIYNGEPVLDLEYTEDAAADTDMNVVMTEHGTFIEIQGTAEGDAFDDAQLSALLGLAKSGLTQIIQQQKDALEKP